MSYYKSIAPGPLQDRLACKVGNFPNCTMTARYTSNALELGALTAEFGSFISESYKPFFSEERRGDPSDTAKIKDPSYFKTD
ncbi:hypothetical protein J6590_002703 [Homalodisca vitripennis]|nr:hypothetical protein J6590_002703 [Homalodisca vitripennis]